MIDSDWSHLYVLDRSPDLTWIPLKKQLTPEEHQGFLLLCPGGTPLAI